MLNTIPSPEPDDSEGPKHDFNFHKCPNGILIESDDHSADRHEDAKTQLEREFGESKFHFVHVYKSDSPEIWQKWWGNQLVGNDDGPEMDDDGPWNSPKRMTPRRSNVTFYDTYIDYGGVPMCLKRIRWIGK